MTGLQSERYGGWYYRKALVGERTKWWKRNRSGSYTVQNEYHYFEKVSIVILYSIKRGKYKFLKFFKGTNCNCHKLHGRFVKLYLSLIHDN